MQHHVDARHVLAIQRSEIMAARAAQAGMGVHILDNMADVHDSVRPAPFAQLQAEILAPELGEHIHIGHPEFGQPIPLFIPQSGQLARHIAAHLLIQPPKQLVAPGQRQTGLPQLLIVTARDVYKRQVLGTRRF